MTNDLIQKAKDKIAANERENDELRQFINTYHKLQGSQRRDYTTNGHTPPPPAKKPEQKQKTKTQVATEVALEKYQATGQPVPTKDILSEMDRIGFGITGNYRESVLAGYLNSKKKVKAIRGKGWIPTEIQH